MGGKFGSLRHYGEVYIANGKAMVGEQSYDVAEQHAGIGPGIARVGIWKMFADVAKSGGAKESVAERMDSYIGV